MGDTPGTAQAPVPEPQTVRVSITPGAKQNDPPTVDMDKCHLSKKNQDQVCWQLSKGHESHDFEVVFRGMSPFQGSTFTKENPCSGPAQVPGDGTPHKYDVSVDGGPPLDPQVIIDP